MTDIGQQDVDALYQSKQRMVRQSPHRMKCGNARPYNGLWVSAIQLTWGSAWPYLIPGTDNPFAAGVPDTLWDYYNWDLTEGIGWSADGPAFGEGGIEGIAGDMATWMGAHPMPSYSLPTVGSLPSSATQMPHGLCALSGTSDTITTSLVDSSYWAQNGGGDEVSPMLFLPFDPVYNGAHGASGFDLFDYFAMSGWDSFANTLMMQQAKAWFYDIGGGGPPFISYVAGRIRIAQSLLPVGYESWAAARIDITGSGLIPVIHGYCEKIAPMIESSPYPLATVDVNLPASVAIGPAWSGTLPIVFDANFVILEMDSAGLIAQMGFPPNSWWPNSLSGMTGAGGDPMIGAGGDPIIGSGGD